MTIIGDGTAHRRTIAAHHLGLRIGGILHRPLDPADAADVFLQRLLGMPVGLEDRSCGLA